MARVRAFREFWSGLTAFAGVLVEALVIRKGRCLWSLSSFVLHQDFGRPHTPVAKGILIVLLGFG